MSATFLQYLHICLNDPQSSKALRIGLLCTASGFCFTSVGAHHSLNQPYLTHLAVSPDHVGFLVLHNVFPGQFSDFTLKNSGHNTLEEGCSGFRNANQLLIANREGYVHLLQYPTMGINFPATHPRQWSSPLKSTLVPIEKIILRGTKSVSPRAPATRALWSAGKQYRLEKT